jgi:hypothetical protein
MMKMKRMKFIYTTAFTVLMLAFSGCKEVIEEPAPQSFEITVRQSEVSYNNAVINVRHNGPEEITWYGYLTEDVTENDYKLYNQMLKEFKNDTGKKGLKRENNRNILLENLKENWDYKYLVFAIDENGKLINGANIGSVKFKTAQNIYPLTKTDDWDITILGRDETKSKEHVEVKANKGGRFGWQYVSKETIDAWEKEYPNGYEIWEDDIYMTTVNGIELFVLQQIIDTQYYIFQGGYKVTDVTYIYEEGKPFEAPRLASGDYYFVAYGFNGDGSHTQKYSVELITIEEEEATPEYEKWLGEYTFTGEADVTDEEGKETKEERTYNICIEKYDNNFMYRVHGWECGDDVQYDWEEDIMQLDKSKNEFLAFPAYYNYETGELEFRETPMTYITFGSSDVLTLGMYGYAYNPTEKAEIPVILDGTPMARALPIAEGETSTVLNGLEGEYTQADGKKVTWEYCKMGYIAWNEYSWQTINPPLRYPIEITKVASADEGSSLASKDKGNMELFGEKALTTDFIKKDFSRLEKKEPVVFKQLL